MLWLFALLGLLPAGLSAQVIATLTPLDNLVQVGRPFRMDLSVRHPENTIVVFPDSASEFAPYELIKSEPRATKTDAGTSVDGTVLSLFTWEIDSVQYLQFPVQFLDASGDTMEVMSNRVEVLFQPMIPAYSDTLKLKLHGGLAEIREPFPWLGFTVVGGTFILLAGLLFLLLRKPVGKIMRRWRVQRDWQAFKRAHERLLPLVPQQEAFTTELQNAWKTYLDRRKRLSLPAMTTPELAKVLANIPVLDESDIDTLTELSHLRDKLLFAGIPANENELRALHARVEAVVAKEFHRRKEAAEV